MLDEPTASPWRLHRRREVYRNRWSTLIEDELRHVDGGEGLQAYFAARDFVVICPQHADGSISLVRQWRHAWQTATWELPCGACDGEAPAVAAARELAEETGLAAEHWQTCGRIRPSDARVGGEGHLFIARGLRRLAATSSADASEVDLHSRRVGWAELCQACDEGRISNVASLYLLTRLRLTLAEAASAEG